MIPERGPQGRVHWPSWRKACWKGDPAGCCAVCYARLVGTQLRYTVKR